MSAIQRLLIHPRSVVVIVLVSLALSLPTVFKGFIVDDPLILSLIEEWYPSHTNAFDVYSSLIEQPQMPWWASAEAPIAFFRVLSSALLRLDHLLFGRWAPGYHLHSLLWLGVLLILVWRFYRRLVPRLAPLALLLFALDECHAFTAGWIANRHAMVSVTFGVAALLAHLRWREEGWRPGPPLAVAGFILALLAGEAGATALAYVGAYELLAGPGEGRRRWLGIAPPIAVGLGYVAWYKSMGYGFQGSGFYIDPSARPLEFLGAACQRIPWLLGGALTGAPPEIGLFQPSARPVLVTLGVVSVLGLALGLRAGRTSLEDGERHHLPWLATGVLLSLIPLAAGMTETRQLLAPMLGIAVLLAALLDIVWRRWWPSANWWRWAAAALGVFLLLIHIGVASLLRIVHPLKFSEFSQVLFDRFETVPDWDNASYQEVLVLNADVLTLFYGPPYLDYLHDTRREHWWVLTAAPHQHRLTRTGANAVEMESLDGEMIASVNETAWPPETELRPGVVIDRGFFTVEVLEFGEVGPTRLRFDFKKPLDDPGLLILKWGKSGFEWGKSGFEKATLPDVGESLLLPDFPPDPLS